MYNVNKILSLTGIVGLRQSSNPDYAFLDTANTTSRSGRFITDNAFVKPEFIKDNFPYKGASDAEINTYLQNKQTAAIKSVLDKVFSEPDFIDHKLVYENAQNKVNLETLPEGFIGFEFEVCGERSLIFEIKRCILEFEGAGDVTLLLFNSSSKLPLQAELVTINSDLQEVELNWRFDNTDSTFKGKYYLGYITSGLTVQPFKRDYESSNLKSYIDGLNIEEMEVANHTDELAIFDLLSVDYSDINAGINPEILVFDDYTNTILANQDLFAPAIEKQFIIDLLQDIIGSPRFNNNQRASKDMLTMITIELEGIDQEDGIKKAGLKRELMGGINHIKKEINRLKDGYFSQGFVLNHR